MIFTKQKLDKQVIGYIYTNHLPGLTSEDAKMLSILNLSFGKIETGNIICDLDDYQECLLKIRRESPDLKLVLSVGGWGAGGFSETMATDAGRKQFAWSARNLVERYHLDGIDIDWEYPCIGISGIKASGEDKENFTLMLKDLRSSLDQIEDRHCLVNIAGGGGNYFLRCTDMYNASRYLDYVQIMTYDLRGGFTIATGHHTNLYDNQKDLLDVSTDRAVKAYLKAGVPREKLVIGAAFYSRMWKGVPDANHGWMQMAESAGGYGPDYGELAESYINKNGFKRYWDDEAKAPWLFNGDTFISYEDGESIRHKAKYVKELGLAGMMFWEYGCDSTKTLTRIIRESFSGD